MNYTEILACLKLVYNPRGERPQSVIPYLKGKPGVGKSALVADYATWLSATSGHNYALKILRLSDLMAEDLAGIPRPDDISKTVSWYVPATMPVRGNSTLSPDSRGILFLDELNRAKPDVLQAAMRILDRQEFLSHWIIVCAGNLGDADGTSVTELDSAQERRLMTITMDFSASDWLDWAKNAHIDDDIMAYVGANPQHGHYTYSNDSGQVAYVTPAHWVSLSNIFVSNQDILDKIQIVNMLGGPILGPIAPAFRQFLLDNQSLTVQDVLGLADNPALAQKFITSSRDQIYSLNASLVSYFSDIKLTKNDKRVKSVLSYLNLVDDNDKKILSQDTLLALLGNFDKTCKPLLTALTALDDSLTTIMLSLWQSTTIV